MMKVFYAPQLDESESTESHAEVLQLSTSDYINHSECTTDEPSHQGDVEKDAQNGEMEQYQVTDDFCTSQSDPSKTPEDFATDGPEAPGDQQQDQVCLISVFIFKIFPNMWRQLVILMSPI